MELVILYFSLAIGMSFLCSVLEAVLLSTPVSFITMKEQQGARNARLLRNLKTNIDRPIAAILSLNTVAHTLGAAGVGAEAVKVFGEEYFGVISAILTILILVFSEIIPKTLGSYYWRELSTIAAPAIQTMIIVSFPLVWLSEWVTKVVFRSASKNNSVSREEVSAMVSVGTQEGVIEKSESKVIENLFRLDDIKVHSIMTPRTVSVVSSENMTLREFYDNKMTLSYSRIPVYKNDDDFITGYVLKQTVLELLVDDKDQVQISEIRRPILSFDRETPVGDVWEAMLKAKEHIAQVIDEYGCFLGIVTMEDVIETLIGQEIIDENDMVVDMQDYAREKWKNELENK